MLDVCVALPSRLPALLWPPYLWLILGRLFWLRRYWASCCVSIVATVVRSIDVTTACNSTFMQLSTLSSSTTCLRPLCREVVDQGHRPQGTLFCVLVLLGECELPGSCVHPPVWLMSQEFPETESPAGFAALESSARFTGPPNKGRRPKNQSSNSQRPPLGSSHPQGLLRGLFLQVSHRLPPAVTLQRASLPSRSQRLRRACLQSSAFFLTIKEGAVPRLPRSPGIAFQVLPPAGSRTLSSTPLGAQRELALRPPAWRSDSPAALAFNEAEEKVVRVPSILSRRSCLGFSQAGVKCCLWPGGCGFSAERTICEIDDLQHTYRTTPSGLHLWCAGPVFFFYLIKERGNFKVSCGALDCR